MISKTSLLLLLLLSIVALASAISVQRVPIADVTSAPAHFVQNKLAKSYELVQFKILLKQRNLDILEEKFWDVSSPKSENYGKFLSKEEIDSIVAPSPKDVKVVVNWLVDNGLTKNEMIVHSDFIQVRTNVGKASTLFETSFAHYSSSRTALKRIRVVGQASMPMHVLAKVDLVLGLSDFIEDNKMSESMRATKKQVQGSTVSITPAVIKQYYGIPTGQIGVESENFQSIAAFSDFYSSGALQFFDQKFGIDSSTVRVKNVGQNCIAQNCDQMESDLDVQYMTAIGNNITTLFLSSGNGEWIIDWATAIQQYNPIPKIASISYGWAEVEQCEITNSCSTLGIDSVIYVARSNVELQKVGLRGVSVFVSSGDDGAPSFGAASGNCPIDGTKQYCPLGGCNHKSSQCPMITIMESNGTQCFFPMGSESNACQSMLQNQNFVNGINEFVSSNSKCQVALEQDTQQNYHIYSSCTCDKLKPYSDSDAGFKIVGYSYDQDAGTLFQPDYPASSPFITSVGATQITDVTKPEIVCSVATGAIITGGGGVAITQAQPSYQADAVATYIKSGTLPPSYSYNATNRFYPDLTLVGHAYEIAVPNTLTSNTCPCALESVDGTSCSSPTLAGMISLINDKLIGAGKPTLGFLNPLLYQAAKEQPNVFNDITTGANNCNRAYCCQYGYTATTGYDAASGLGSINFKNFEQYVLSLN
ncbi:hypothetical protein ACTFIW_001103 [Dictyostelium discoideum]